MKQGKRPTRKQKEKMKNLPSPQNWLVVTETKERLQVVHRDSKEVRILALCRA